MLGATERNSQAWDSALGVAKGLSTDLLMYAAILGHVDWPNTESSSTLWEE